MAVNFCHFSSKPPFTRHSSFKSISSPQSDFLSFKAFNGNRERSAFDGPALKQTNLKQKIPTLKFHPQKIMSASQSQLSSASSKESFGNRANPYSVLFVCLGNICRSPSAEAVFKSIVKRNGLSHKFVIDSAGTIDYHEGGPADPRMKKAGAKRGYDLTSISRPIRTSDFETFDIILAMDKQNQADILKFVRKSNSSSLPQNYSEKVQLMCSFCQHFTLREVPDPYYGGPEGFEKVLDLLEDACNGLLTSILNGDV